MDINEMFVRLFFVIILCLIMNISLGMWRVTTKKFSLTWFISIHLAVPLVYLLRVKNSLASWSIVVLVIFSVLGQITGGLLIRKLSNNRNLFAIRVKQPYGREGNFIIRFLWITCGILSLTIGFVGIFLPLIPTVPLVLFSALAFAKSSQFLHNWLTNHKFFRPIIKDWQQNRKIPMNAKILSAMLMIISITIAIVYLSNR